MTSAEAETCADHMNAIGMKVEVALVRCRGRCVVELTPMSAVYTTVLECQAAIGRFVIGLRAQ